MKDLVYKEAYITYKSSTLFHKKNFKVNIAK
jgi:hypothetical protein